MRATSKREQLGIYLRIVAIFLTTCFSVVYTENTVHRDVATSCFCVVSMRFSVLASFVSGAIIAVVQPSQSASHARIIHINKTLSCRRNGLQHHSMLVATVRFQCKILWHRITVGFLIRI